MDLCPCSPDVGDCNRCGTSYPPTTNGKPPRHEDYPFNIPPGPLRETLRPLAVGAMNAYRAGDMERFETLRREADTIRKNAAARGIASGHHTRKRVAKLFGDRRRRKTQRRR